MSFKQKLDSESLQKEYLYFNKHFPNAVDDKYQTFGMYLEDKYDIHIPEEEYISTYKTFYKLYRKLL